MKQIRYILLLAAIGLVSSCIADDSSVNQGALTRGEKAIDINLEIKNNKLTKQELTEPGDFDNSSLNENKIDKIDLFFFNLNAELAWHIDPEAITQGENTLRIRLNPERSLAYEDKNFKIVAVANANEALNGVQSLEELQQRILTYNTINTPQTPQPNFLMDGEIHTGPIIWDDEDSYKPQATLSLKRAAAKIRLRIKEVAVRELENGVEVPYEMVDMPEVRLINYTTKTSLLSGTPYAATKEELDKTAYAPVEKLSYPGMVNDKTKNNEFLALSVPFYSFERDWSAAREDAPTLLVKVNLKSGNQPARPYYYTVPVNYRLPLPGMSNEEKRNLYRFQRNHLYDVVTSINTLGSEDEQTPLELTASIGVEPWNEIEVVGDLQSAHYLVVKNERPIMPNIESIEVEYLSDLPLEELTIDKTWYEYYERGSLIRIEYDGKVRKEFINDMLNERRIHAGFNGVALKDVKDNPTRKSILITSPIPDNFVPLYIEFTVKQQGTNLQEKVVATQYPPKYITGERSPGFVTEYSNPYADFRYHDTFGAGGQINNVFYKVTTIVNEEGELIGDPTDSSGRTRMDPQTNRVISPQFIIATQHGMSPPNMTQHDARYSNGTGWNSVDFKYGTGPRSELFEDREPYASIYPSLIRQLIRYNSETALDRCATYFEGEYGTDGTYVEYFLRDTQSGYPLYDERVVEKKFKYQGKWRMPTAAEVQLIDAIQDEPASAVKSLLWGEYYWTAEMNVAYNFNKNEFDYSRNDTRRGASVRCVFDTYKLENHP